jgi:hypothetical protein
MSRKAISYKLAIGYALTSTVCNPREPQTVIVGEAEQSKARYVRLQTIDGSEYATFKIGKRYYWQLTVSLQKIDLGYTEFSVSDIEPSQSWDGRISAETSDLIDAPLWWHDQGLQETPTGYGKQLTTSRMIFFQGMRRRVYCTCFSNNGTCWFKYGKKKIIVG